MTSERRTEVEKILTEYDLAKIEGLARAVIKDTQGIRMAAFLLGDTHPFATAIPHFFSIYERTTTIMFELLPNYLTEPTLISEINKISQYCATQKEILLAQRREKEIK